MPRDGRVGPRAVGRQRHRCRLQRGAFLQRCRGTLFLRGDVPNAKPNRRQSDHGLQRLRVMRRLVHRSNATKTENFEKENNHMRSATATESPTGLTLENVLYERKGAVAYVTL